MIFPISHEDHQARRWPVVTIGIIAVCVLVHLFFVVTGGIGQGTDRIRSTGYDAVEFLAQRPYLRPPAELAAWMDEDLSAADKAALAKGRERGAPDDADVEAEQAALERKFASFQKAIAEAPLYRFGFVPRRRNWVALLTSMFMHGGWLHLIGNLWLLWLCGCNLEDRWGRPVFGGAYALAGACATLLHMAMFPKSFVPLIGASGAIAGAMGGFLVAFARTKIRFAYLLGMGFRWRAGTFSAPAYLMLPMWFVWELFSASYLSGTGVAHWAHVGGFGIGALVALGLRYSGVEKRLDAAVESKVAVAADPRVLAAVEHLDHARPGQAISLLEQVLKDDPGHIDALLSLMRAASDLRDDALQARTCTRLIERYWAMGQVDTAIALFEEPKPTEVDALMPRDLALRVARHFAATKQAAKAATLCFKVRRDGLTDETAVRAAVLEATVRLGMGDVAKARSLLTLSKESPFCTFEIDQMIDTQMAKVEAEERSRALAT